MQTIEHTMTNSRKTTSARVFLVHPPREGKTVTAAECYGQIVHLLDRDVAPWRADDFTGRLNAALDAYHYDPNVDYLCLTGTVAAIGLACAVLGARVGRKEIVLPSSRGEGFKVLMFNAVTSEYDSIKVVP